MFSGPERDLYMKERFIWFMTAHWRGVVLIFAPIIFFLILVPLPPSHSQWTFYVLCIVGTYWVTECIPLPISSFIPAVVFPMTGVLSTKECLQAYINDCVLMFLGCLMLAASIEQSGLHKRLAFRAIRCCGYSHFKLLMSLSFITMFISMWITNTAATTMTVPIVFVILKVFENQGIMKIYKRNSKGENVATPLTICYFCMTAYAATIGGIGTLMGTATNLAFKGLYTTAYPDEPDQLSFLRFSMFGIPLMLCLWFWMYISMIIMFLGWFRPGSEASKNAVIPQNVQEEAKKSMEIESKKLGTVTYWEWSVLILFLAAIGLFFSRSPQFFNGWGDNLLSHYNIPDGKFIQDSTVAIFVAFLMFLLPSTAACIKTCTVPFKDELPKGPIRSILDWKTTTATLPYSFVFLLGGGFAILKAIATSGLDTKIGNFFKFMTVFPIQLVVGGIVTIVILVTNLASNVVTANLLVPVFMQMALSIDVSPLWFCVAVGFSSSFCFMMPVGTPGNLIVQRAANIPTTKMMKAGFAITIITILVMTNAMFFLAPRVWNFGSGKAVEAPAAPEAPAEAPAAEAPAAEAPAAED